MVDPEGPLSAGRRGALGVANSRRDSRPGGWVWKRERGVLLCLAGCPWCPDPTKAAGGQRVEGGGGGAAWAADSASGASDHYRE